MRLSRHIPPLRIADEPHPARSVTGLVPADTPATARASLHVLVDALPDADLEEARHLLSTLKGIDPALRAALLAPVDDEPFTDKDRQSADAARDAYRRGEWVSGDEVRREIGW